MTQVNVCTVYRGAQLNSSDHVIVTKRGGTTQLLIRLFNIMSKRSLTKLAIKLLNKQSVTRRQAQKWGCDFDALLADPRGLELFSEYSRKNLASENIDFWLAVNEFKKRKPKGEKLREEARKIFRVYVCTKGEKQINVNAKIRCTIIQNIEDPTLDIFDDAHEKIYVLMKTDIYTRFIRDETYLSLVRTDSSGS